MHLIAFSTQQLAHSRHLLNKTFGGHFVRQERAVLEEWKRDMFSPSPPFPKYQN
jgi:hypothetical protein